MVLLCLVVCTLKLVDASACLINVSADGNSITGTLFCEGQNGACVIESLNMSGDPIDMLVVSNSGYTLRKGATSL